MQPHYNEFSTALSLLLSILQVVTSTNDQADSLRLVHVVFRHGQRTPADTYPNDPYEKHKFEPFGWGQLTNAGKKAQFEQGEWLRQRYSALLGDMYSPAQFKAQCTDVDRAKMSTQLMLAGLYPPKGDQVWNPSLLWQPIPLDYEPLKYDKLLLGRFPCPRYQEELDSVMKSEEVKSILETNRQLLDHVSTQSGMTISTPDDAQSLYSTLKAEKDYGLTLPDWTNRVFPDPLSKITAQSFVINGKTPQLQKLKGGFLLKKIIADTTAKLVGKSQMRMFAYGGHDSTVANLLLAMDTWDLQIPEYNALVMMEIHQIQPDEHGVKIYLRNTTAEEPYLLQVPGCAKLCPWETFIQLTESKIPAKLYEEECRSTNPNFVYVDNTSGP
uniref:Venom acid phosphatase Acph-1 n=1 Tax=Cacopsylla melanoneura TaxID=428564 RepID=A0A8D8S6A7_9HEMI